MKLHRLALASPALLLLALACSDNPAGNGLRMPRSGSFAITPSGTLDENIVGILALLPKGLETAATTRWSNIKSKYAAGLTDPSQMAVAKQMLFELSAWVKMKAPDMDAPPNGESKTAASARAVLYMAMYIHLGPGSPPPSYNPGADAVIGLVTPGAAATVVTPTRHAGVAFEAGSVDENTIIVVSQNLTPYQANCSGPLQTLLCQYPAFYTFEQFPHKRLLKAATFSVCHINAGESRTPLADHDRFRLAHTKPADAADYTPGGTIRDQNGESIEILPLTTQSFTTCLDTRYEQESPPIEVIGAWSKLRRGLARLVTPKAAYAIDQGLGGRSFSFSPFNDVDPDGRPDRAVQGLAAAPVCGPNDCLVHPGTHLTVSFSVANIGTASTGDGALGLVQLVVPGIEGPPTFLPLGTFQVAQVVPGQSVPFNMDVVVPADIQAGSYTIQATVGIGFFPEIPPDLANNSQSVPLTVTATVPVIGFNVLPGSLGGETSMASWASAHRPITQRQGQSRIPRYN